MNAKEVERVIEKGKADSKFARFIIELDSADSLRDGTRIVRDEDRILHGVRILAVEFQTLYVVGKWGSFKIPLRHIISVKRDAKNEPKQFVNLTSGGHGE